MSSTFNNTDSTAPTGAVMLTSNEVARLLKISMRTLWRMHSRGSMPKAIRIGGVVRWSSEVIQKWIADGCPNQAACENEARRRD